MVVADSFFYCLRIQACSKTKPFGRSSLKSPRNQNPLSGMLSLKVSSPTSNKYWQLPMSQYRFLFQVVEIHCSQKSLQPRWATKTSLQSISSLKWCNECNPKVFLMLPIKSWTCWTWNSKQTLSRLSLTKVHLTQSAAIWSQKLNRWFPNT